MDISVDEQFAQSGLRNRRTRRAQGGPLSQDQLSQRFDHILPQGDMATVELHHALAARHPPINCSFLSKQQQSSECYSNIGAVHRRTEQSSPRQEIPWVTEGFGHLKVPTMVSHGQLDRTKFQMFDSGIRDYHVRAILLGHEDRFTLFADANTGNAFSS